MSVKFSSWTKIRTNKQICCIVLNPGCWLAFRKLIISVQSDAVDGVFLLTIFLVLKMDRMTTFKSTRVSNSFINDVLSLFRGHLFLQIIFQFFRIVWSTFYSISTDTVCYIPHHFTWDVKLNTSKLNIFLLL